MPDDPILLRADSPAAALLVAQGRTVTARSWGARLDAPDVDRDHLRRLVLRADGIGQVRALTDADVGAALALDAAAAGDYPGGPATAHIPLTPVRARVGEGRCAYGVVESDGTLTAMT